MIKEQIDSRLDGLIKQGEDLFNESDYVKHPSLDDLSLVSFARTRVDEKDMPTYQSWLSSSCNIINLLAPKSSYYHTEIKEILTNKKTGNSISYRMVARILGLLKSVKDEFSQGLLRDVEYIIAAGTFDDFLDHASSYHKSDKKIESSILASTVFEDVIKKLSEKNDLKGRSTEERIKELVKKDIITSVKAKRLRVYAGIRNNALHAKWEEFDIKDVGEMIGGLRELIETYL
jgi:uncharacterized protein YutE (UPF0331/DUF86 family)